MRLLLITNVFPSAHRPTKGTFNGEMVAALRAAGEDVRVVVPVPWTDLSFRNRPVSADADTTYRTWWYPPRWRHQSYHRWMAAALAATIRQVTRGWQPDLVLSYWAHPDGAVAMQIARRLDVPGVILVGGSDVLVLTAKPARRAAVVAALRNADRVLAVGTPLQQATVALGVNPDRVGAFFRGVDRSLFHAGDRHAARARLGLPLDRPVFLWVGRMAPVKGLDVLLAAWATVSRHPSRPILLLVGDGEQRASVQQSASPYGDSVRLIGAVPYRALPDWYRAADSMVLPSRSEGMPNVLLEALACGTPFVASAVGSVIELARRPDDLVPPGDATALAAALVRRLECGFDQENLPEIPDRAEAITALQHQLASVVAAAATTARREEIA